MKMRSFLMPAVFIVGSCSAFAMIPNLYNINIQNNSKHAIKWTEQDGATLISSTGKKIPAGEKSHLRSGSNTGKMPYILIGQSCVYKIGNGSAIRMPTPNVAADLHCSVAGDTIIVK